MEQPERMWPDYLRRVLGDEPAAPAPDAPAQPREASDPTDEAPRRGEADSAAQTEAPTGGEDGGGPP